MKKYFKSSAALLLCAIMIIAVFPHAGAAAAFDVSVTTNAVTDGNTLMCITKLANKSNVSGDVVVWSVVYHADGIEKSRDKKKIPVGANSSVTESISVGYDSSIGETARLFFWKGDSMEPVHSSVYSEDVPEGAIDLEPIEITSDMVFASMEVEGSHRVTDAADGDADTYWTANGVARGSEASVTAYLQYDYEIKRVGILFGEGLNRQYVFKVSTSVDGNTYTEVLGETTSALSDEMQYFFVTPSIGKFLRFTVVERVVPDANNWVQIAEIEAFGEIQPVPTGDEVELFQFDGKEGTLLPTSANASVADGWIARSMTEESYKNYTPSLGDNIYAEVAYLPVEAGMGSSETALHLLDNVGRTTDAALGAGGVLAAKQYTTNADRGRYAIKFNMFIPSVMENGEASDVFWSGFSLTDEMVTGGADISHYAAIQVRMEEANGKIALRGVNSNQFNEGSLINFMSTTFEKDTLWEVTIEVDPIARRTDITVTDGINTETRPLYFAYNDAEKARISAWSGLEAKWLVFNTGAGSSNEIYVDDVSVTHFEEENSPITQTVTAEYDMTEDNNGNMTYVNLADSQGSYTGSLGDKLYAELTSAPAESGIDGDALHLYDAVGRETDETNGAGGVMAFVDLPVPENNNAYKVEFTIYAPVADDYGGFSLGSGHNSSGPFGMQMRFKSNDSGLQLNMYPSNNFNSGTWEAAIGSYTAIKPDVPWDVEIIVNPTKLSYDITIDDGANVQTRTKAIPNSNENWTSNKLDTLSFNTGIGGNGDIYVGDIKVTDLGSPQNSLEAVHGIIRLQANHGTGNMLHHQGNEISDFAEKQNPAYTRFVERSGLMDSDGVSFEVMNRPGYFLTIVPGTENKLQVQPYSNTVRFKANATFMKQDGNSDPKGFGKSTVSYASYRDRDRYIYNNSGSTVVWKRYEKSRSVFYLRNEAANSRISDNFKGTSIDTGKWVAQYPWGDKHNHYGLCSKSAIVLKDGVCTLKAIKIGENDWPKDSKGETGIDLSSYGFGGWKKWQGYVGVISSGYASNRIFWRQSYMEGSFKQPNAGYGFWTAFWLSGVNNWPPETDIFEYLSSSGSAGAHGWFTNMHWSGSAQGNWYQGSNLRTQFHTYALDWGYDYMDFYYDGSCYARYTGDIVNYQNSQGGMTMIINNGIGGWESSLPSAWDIGLSIDWFRSFQY